MVCRRVITEQRLFVFLVGIDRTFQWLFDVKKMTAVCRHFLSRSEIFFVSCVVLLHTFCELCRIAVCFVSVVLYALFFLFLLYCVRVHDVCSRAHTRTCERHISPVYCSFVPRKTVICLQNRGFRWGIWASQTRLDMRLG